MKNETPVNKSAPAYAQINEEWMSWLKRAIYSGDTPDYITKTMIDGRFNPKDITRTMRDCMAEYGWAGDIRPPVDHAAIADIPFVHKVGTQGIQKIAKDGIQLYTVDDFLSAEECEQLIPIVKANLVPSVVAGYATNANRTSSTGKLYESNDPMVPALENRIAAMLGLGPRYGEALQGQVYEVGQYFKPHTDHFLVNSDIHEQYTKLRGNRTWTFMIYLNDVPKGGDTSFPNINHQIMPKRGMAVVWNNLHPDGSGNTLTLHGGDPIEEGQKIIITHWFREYGIGPMFPG